jgi:hypothetical protein
MRLRFICAAVAVILVGICYLLVGLIGSPVAVLVTAGLSCLLPYGLWKFLESEPQPEVDVYLPGVAALIGVILGNSVRRLSGLSQPMLVDVLAAMLAAVGSGIIIALRLRARRACCELCRHPLTQPSYQCPRCERMVCNRSRCWIDESYRCSDCERYQVPLFPSQADWWFVRLGPRLAGGRCLRCKRDAGECDLRPCGQCPWAMCTQCWDLENGRCMRCHWRIPDLPESLRES